MNKPKFYVDFNEMLDSNLVLFAAEDFKIDSNGDRISLHQGLEIIIYMDDTDDDGVRDDLIASGVVEKNETVGWGKHVIWCCRIDSQSILHESEIETRI